MPGTTEAPKYVAHTQPMGTGTGTGIGTGTGMWTGWARRDFISAHSWLFHKENNSRIGIRVIKYTPL